MIEYVTPLPRPLLAPSFFQISPPFVLFSAPSRFPHPTLDPFLAINGRLPRSALFYYVPMRGFVELIGSPPTKFR